MIPLDSVRNQGGRGKINYLSFKKSIDSNSIYEIFFGRCIGNDTKHTSNPPRNAPDPIQGVMISPPSPSPNHYTLDGVGGIPKLIGSEKKFETLLMTF